MTHVNHINRLLKLTAIHIVLLREMLYLAGHRLTQLILHFIKSARHSFIMLLLKLCNNCTDLGLKTLVLIVIDLSDSCSLRLGYIIVIG